MRTYRSPLRLFAFGLVGIILIVAAIDVMFGHWLSTAPEDTNGTLTTRGQAQQRGDILWGAAMIGAGTLLVGGAVVELVRRKSLVVVTADGLVMAIGHHEEDVVAPWSVVEDVTSDTVVDPYDGATRNVLVVAFSDRRGFPDEPLGATWNGDTLLIDAHDWTRRVTDVALSAQGALGHYRRVEEIKQMGPPSVEWDSEDDDSQNLEPDALVAVAGGAVAATAGDDDAAGQAVAEVPNPDALPVVGADDSVDPDASSDRAEDGDATADDARAIDDESRSGEDSVDPEIPLEEAAVMGSVPSLDDEREMPQGADVPSEFEAETEAISEGDGSLDGDDESVKHDSDGDDHPADESVDDTRAADQPERVVDQQLTDDRDPEPEPEPAGEPTVPPTIAGAFGAARFGTRQPAHDAHDGASLDDEAGRGVTW